MYIFIIYTIYYNYYYNYYYYYYYYFYYYYCSFSYIFPGIRDVTMEKVLVKFNIYTLINKFHTRTCESSAVHFRSRFAYFLDDLTKLNYIHLFNTCCFH